MEEIVELTLTNVKFFELLGPNNLKISLFFCDSTLQRCFQESMYSPNVKIIVTHLETTAEGKPGLPKKTYVWKPQHPILCLEERQFYFRMAQYPETLPITRFLKFHVIEDFHVPSSTAFTSDFLGCCPPDYDHFVVRIGERSFEICKYQLCAESEYFAAMLRTECKEATENECRFDDLDPNIFYDLVLYVNFGQLCSLEKAKNLYVLADRFQMPRLAANCEAWMLDCLNENNQYEIFRLASVFGSPQFRHSLAEKVVWNFSCWISHKLRDDEGHASIRREMGSIFIDRDTKCYHCYEKFRNREKNAESHIRRRHIVEYYCVSTEAIGPLLHMIDLFPTVLSLMQYYETICIRVKDRLFKICKADLCSESAYFEEEFESNPMGQYRIDDVDPKLFSALLKYLYHGEMQMTDPVIGILMLAMRFRMPNIVNICVVGLVQQYKGKEWKLKKDRTTEFQSPWDP